MTSPEDSLLFVYNADSGFFNTVADIGHKIWSPSTYACDLCMLTHGYFSERQEWRSFIEKLGMKCDFLHRDQFRRQYREEATELPAIFRCTRDGIHPCVTARQLRDCNDLEQLEQLIINNCLDSTKCERKIP